MYQTVFKLKLSVNQLKYQRLADSCQSIVLILLFALKSIVFHVLTKFSHIIHTQRLPFTLVILFVSVWYGVKYQFRLVDVKRVRERKVFIWIRWNTF